jgi:hypothetical protein
MLATRPALPTVKAPQLRTWLERVIDSSTPDSAMAASGILSRWPDQREAGEFGLPKPDAHRRHGPTTAPLHLAEYCCVASTQMG